MYYIYLKNDYRHGIYRHSFIEILEWLYWNHIVDIDYTTLLDKDRLLNSVVVEANDEAQSITEDVENYLRLNKQLEDIKNKY